MGRHPLWAIWISAVTLRAAYVIAAPPNPFGFGDSAEYDAIARALLEGRGLVEAGNAGIRPPLYPLFVAAMYALGDIPALQVAQVLIGASTAVAIAKLGGMLYGTHGSWSSGALAAAYPWFFYYVGALATETLFTLLVVATFVTLLRATRTDSIGSIIAAGVVFGLASLVRGNFLVFGPLLAAWTWWQGGGSRRALLFVLGAALALAPVSAYHAQQGRGLGLAGAGGGGVQFYIGNNPDQTLLYSGALSDEEWRDLNAQALGPGGLAFLGCAQLPCKPLAERDAFFMQAALRYIATHPADWGVTALRKMLRTWQPWVEPLAYSVPLVVVSGLSFSALLVLTVLGIRRMRREGRSLLLVAAVGTTATSVLFVASLRYRFPILDPFLLAAAGPQLGLALEGIFVALGIKRRGQVDPLIEQASAHDEREQSGAQSV